MSKKWEVIIAVASIVLAVVLWRWPWPLTKKPDLYSLRVQVVDPARTPVRNSMVRTSAGNEPHLLPDGWWEVQIPRAKVPVDGRVSVWAEHADWATAHAEVRLDEDAEPNLELRLQPPQGTVPGIVVDAQGRGVAGARVTVLEHAVGAAETDRDGRFHILLTAAAGTKVTLHVEHPDHLSQDAFCYVGTSCPVYLDGR
jgi:hypothetical protein